MPLALKILLGANLAFSLFVIAPMFALGFYWGEMWHWSMYDWQEMLAEAGIGFYLFSAMLLLATATPILIWYDLRRDRQVR